MIAQKMNQKLILPIYKNIYLWKKLIHTLRPHSLTLHVCTCVLWRGHTKTKLQLREFSLTLHPAHIHIYISMMCKSVVLKLQSPLFDRGQQWSDSITAICSRASSENMRSLQSRVVLALATAVMWNRAILFSGVVGPLFASQHRARDVHICISP